MADLISPITGMLFALWLGVACWAIWTGLAMRKRARANLRQFSRISRLLDSSPAIPLLVRADGRLEAPERLALWLGLPNIPRYISELHEDNHGLNASDLKILTDDVISVQKTGQTFTRSLTSSASSRTLLFKGGLADGQISPNGAALIWVFDATESEQEIAELGKEVDRAQTAFVSLSGLIEASPIPMWHRGDDLRITLVNDAYVKAVDGESGEQVVQQGLEFIEKLDDVTAMSAAAQALEEGIALERLVPATLNGERRMMRVVDVPLGDAGVAGYAIDVQDVEDAQHAFKQFGTAQRNMLDKMSAGVAQFDADRALTFCNLPFQRIFSIRHQWVSNKPEFDRLLDRMRDANRLPEVRDFPEWREERRQWFISSEPEEENWLLSDGTHLRVLVHPTPDGGLLLIFEDRTEQVQLASARDTLLRVRTATFDNLFEAIAVFSADGKLNIWNNKFADVWQLTADDLSNHPRVDALMKKMATYLKKPSQISLVRDLVRSATAEREQKSGRLTFANGKHYEFAAIPLPDGNALFTMLDISDSRKIEQALRDKNEALTEADSIKARFLSNMSYEFRTPLTSIGGFAELLQTGIAGPLSEQGTEYVQAILDSVHRLGTQIDNVLDLSQSEAGALPIAKNKVDLTKLVEGLAKGFAERAKAEQIEFDVQIDKKLGEVLGDEKRISQALTQLLENALSYTGTDGRILLHADGTTKKARLVVSDNGPGMSASKQSKVFDGFARSREIDSKSEKPGLGLPLARQLTEAHGGKLSLISELGQGTVVTMELPRK